MLLPYKMSLRGNFFCCTCKGACLCDHFNFRPSREQFSCYYSRPDKEMASPAFATIAHIEPPQSHYQASVQLRYSICNLMQSDVYLSKQCEILHKKMKSLKRLKVNVTHVSSRKYFFNWHHPSFGASFVVRSYFCDGPKNSYSLDCNNAGSKAQNTDKGSHHS